MRAASMGRMRATPVRGLLDDPLEAVELHDRGDKRDVYRAARRREGSSSRNTTRSPRASITSASQARESSEISKRCPALHAQHAGQVAGFVAAQFRGAHVNLGLQRNVVAPRM